MVRALAWATGRKDNTIDTMNPSSHGMLMEEVEIENHKPFIEENGAVYFDYNWRCIITHPFSGYIYVPEMKAIVYKVEVEKIIDLKTILNEPQEQSYVPVWREQCLRGIWPRNSLIPALAGKKHPQSRTWVKVTNIRKLAVPIKDPTRLIKWRDKKPLQQFIPPLRRGVYIDDSRL